MPSLTGTVGPVWRLRGDEFSRRAWRAPTSPPRRTPSQCDGVAPTASAAGTAWRRLHAVADLDRGHDVREDAARLLVQQPDFLAMRRFLRKSLDLRTDV